MNKARKRSAPSHHLTHEFYYGIAPTCTGGGIHLEVVSDHFQLAGGMRQQAHAQEPTHPYLSCSSSASRKSSRTFRSASPTHLSRISGPLTSFGGRAPSRRLSSLARRVLPQPGGPWSRRPRTWPTPSACRSLDTRYTLHVVWAGGREGGGDGGVRIIRYSNRFKKTIVCNIKRQCAAVWRWRVPV